MMETAEDTLRVFNRGVQEVLDATIKVHEQLEKGRIEPGEAFDEWETRMTYLTFLIRKNKAYINRLRVYAKQSALNKKAAIRS